MVDMRCVYTLFARICKAVALCGDQAGVTASHCSPDRVPSPHLWIDITGATSPTVRSSTTSPLTQQSISPTMTLTLWSQIRASKGIARTTPTELPCKSRGHGRLKFSVNDISYQNKLAALAKKLRQPVGRDQSELRRSRLASRT